MIPEMRDLRQPVVLLSGGLDSAVCLALHPGALALSVGYGQPHEWLESERAERLAERYGSELCVATVDLPFEISRDPAMVVPGRNLILLSLAATLGRPVIGCNADDWEVYEDCRPAFFRSVPFDVETPLLYMTKPEIGRLAVSLGVPVEDTWSCYFPTGDKACGKCDACKGRERALA